MIIMFVQSDKYNPNGLLKKSHSVSPALSNCETHMQFTTISLLDIQQWFK